MKADVIIDGEVAHRVEVIEQDGQYRVRIRDAKTEVDEEIIVDFDAAGAAANLIIGDQSFLVELFEENGQYRVDIEGHSMEARLSTAADRLRDLLHTSLDARHDSIEAGMPGAVLEVFVKAGDEVAEGDKLVVLESMKMENTIRAPHAGVIATVDVAKGDNVQTGQTLLTFEAEES